MKRTELSLAQVSPCVRLFIESLLDGVDNANFGEKSPLFDSEAVTATWCLAPRRSQLKQLGLKGDAS